MRKTVPEVVFFVFLAAICSTKNEKRGRFFVFLTAVRSKKNKSTVYTRTLVPRQDRTACGSIEKARAVYGMQTVLWRVQSCQVANSQKADQWVQKT